MSKLIFKLTLITFGILASLHSAQAGELERRIFSVVVNKEGFSPSKSTMFIEFPVKEYGYSIEEFLRKTSELSPVEKTFKNYLICRREWTYESCKDSYRDDKGNLYSRKKIMETLENRPKGNEFIDILMALHLGDLVQFTFTKKDSNGQATPGVTVYEKINRNRYRELRGAMPYHASLTMISAIRTLIEPENYPHLPRDIVKSLGPDRIQYVMPFKDKGNRKPESIPKGQRIVLYLKGHPFYLNLLDEKINMAVLEKHPALAFYRQYLLTLSSGIKEEAYQYYWEPDTLKSMKQSIEGMTKEQFKNYGMGKAEDGSEIRFLIDADPYYFIIYAMRKGQSPDKEIWQLARIYKTPNDGYKMTDVKLVGDDLTYTFFKTDFKDRVLMSRIRDHIKISKKK